MIGQFLIGSLHPLQTIHYISVFIYLCIYVIIFYARTNLLRESSFDSIDLHKKKTGLENNPLEEAVAAIFTR